jgi:hypothetical protein
MSYLRWVASQGLWEDGVDGFEIDGVVGVVGFGAVVVGAAGSVGAVTVAIASSTFSVCTSTRRWQEVARGGCCEMTILTPRASNSAMMALPQPSNGVSFGSLFSHLLTPNLQQSLFFQQSSIDRHVVRNTTE